MSSPDARAVPDDFFADDESYVPKRALEDAAELKRELIRKWRAADGAEGERRRRGKGEREGEREDDDVKGEQREEEIGRGAGPTAEAEILEDD